MEVASGRDADDIFGACIILDVSERDQEATFMSLDRSNRNLHSSPISYVCVVHVCVCVGACVNMCACVCMWRIHLCEMIAPSQGQLSIGVTQFLCTSCVLVVGACVWVWVGGCALCVCVRARVRYEGGCRCVSWVGVCIVNVRVCVLLWVGVYVCVGRGCFDICACGVSGCVSCEGECMCENMYACVYVECTFTWDDCPLSMSACVRERMKERLCAWPRGNKTYVSVCVVSWLND